MSLTKLTSPDSCGGYDPDYEEWSDSLPPLTEQDYEQMAALWDGLDTQLTANAKETNCQ
jgi:hypothetical protein